MKSKAILPITIILVLFIVVFHGFLFDAFTLLKDPYGDNWYSDIVDEVAIDYLQKAEMVDEKLYVVQYNYSNYDQNTVIQNRNRDEKEYPFDKVDVIVATRAQRYTVYICVDEVGQLQVEKYEKGRGTDSNFI